MDINNIIDINKKIETLEDSRAQRQTIIHEAQCALNEAKARQKMTGEYADPAWFAKTKNIIREETTALHDINRKLKQYRHLMRSYTPYEAFKRAALEILDTDTYSKIDKLANQLVNTVMV